MHTLIRFLAALALAAIVASCGSDDAEGSGPDSCVPGESAACICGEGPTVGVQICGDEGTFDACDCSGTTAPNQSPNNIASMDAGGSDDAGIEPDMGTESDAGPAFLNACGGVTPLANQPGTVCGDCNDGFYVCDGSENVRCAFNSELNACGGCAPLSAEPNDPCGPCKSGTLQCNGAGILECTGAQETNACGGCSTLSERPGFFCQSASGSSGSLACDSPDSVRCTAPDENVCGGQAVLTGNPATPCGTCQDGRWECASQDAVICTGSSNAQNACGGCGIPLAAEPGASCGACGGTWQCDGTQGVTCSAPLNLCGGCVPLAQAPGTDCGSGEIVTCDGALSTTCKPSATHNACGGTNLLANNPGDDCGTCGDGTYVCLGNSVTACVEDDTRLNPCGGCVPLSANPGEPCAPGAEWQCDGTDAVACGPTMNNSGLNACGGTQMLDGEPGTVCEECGVWACDQFNPDVVFCVGGSPGTQEDENNCGMCGMRCIPGEACIAGQCESDSVVEVAAGDQHVVVRMAGGDLYAWGYNDRNHPVGSGTTISYVFQPEKVALIDDAISVAAGEASGSSAGSTCAVRSNGDVWCWGSNASGELGVGPGLLAKSSIPVKVPGIDSAIQIDAEFGTVCALKSDRTLWCWGENADGQLGRGTTSDFEFAPAQVPGLPSVQDFAVSRSAVCALATTGEIYCWGSDLHGGMGNGAITGDITSPTTIEGTYPAFSQIEPIFLGFVALNPNGAYLWGRGPSPTATGEPSFVSPTIIPGTAGATRVFGGHRVYFIETAGTIQMWGNDFGQSGVLNSTGFVRALDIGPIPTTSPIRDIAGIQGSAFILKDDGGLWTSGNSIFAGDGQLRSISSQITNREYHPVPHFLPLGSELGNCRDGSDNDQDGLTDCEDPDCAVDVGGAEGAGAIADLADASWYNFFEATCATSTALDPEQTYVWTAPRSGTFEFTSGVSTAWLIMEIFDACVPAAVSLACNDNDITAASDPTTVQINAIAGTKYYLVVNASRSRTGPVSIDITEVP